MNLGWLPLLTGIVVLMAPLPAFYSRKHRYRNLHELDIERRNGSWWKMWRNVLRFPGHWVELLRGLLASACVLATIDDLKEVSELYRTHASWAKMVIPIGLAIVSVVLIALLFRYPEKAVAPVPFVAAVLLVLLPPFVSISAVLLGVSCALAFRSLTAFFLALAPSLAILGFLFDRQLWPSVAGGVLALTPVIFAFGRHREIVIPVRRPRSGE